MKRLLELLLTFCMLFSLAACSGETTGKEPTEPTITEPPHTHIWTMETCTSPKTCKVCGATEGGAYEHRYSEATCTRPKTCRVCGATEGVANEHSYAEATCTKPKTCKFCGATDGAANGHSYSEATCAKPKTCTICGAFGVANEHSFEEDICVICGTERLKGVWCAEWVANGSLCGMDLYFDEMYLGHFSSKDIDTCDPAYRDELLQEELDAMTRIDGVYYYGASGGDGEIYAYSTNGNTIYVTIYGDDMILERISENQLKCVRSGVVYTRVDPHRPDNTFAFSANDTYCEIWGIGTYTSPEVIIPDTINDLPVTIIGRHAFSDCTSIQSIAIPDSVTWIGAYAFSGCTGLQSITIPDSVTWIGASAFSGCTSLNYNIYDNGKYLGNSNNPYMVLVEAVDKNVTSCKIHKDTKLILDAFNGCTKLTSITIPNGVTKIAPEAFSGCAGLQSVTIPDSVTWIGSWAFSGCTSLPSITIPGSVTGVNRLFYGCTGLQSVTICDGVTWIDNYAFSGCSSLQSITIPNSVTWIGYNAFEGCSSLQSITIPSSVADISSYMFYGCTSLQSITIPDSVTKIGYGAFEGCSNLTTIRYAGSVKQWRSINLGYKWNKDIPATQVECADGVVSLK